MRLLLILNLFPLLLTAGCATPTQLALDAEVRRLCAIDGGIRVYEQVKLPAEEFDRWGMPKMYQERVENKAAYRHDDKRTVMEFVMKTRVDSARHGNVRVEEYLLKSETTYYRRGNPEMWHTHVQITRRRDGKILGESKRYSRRGGDMLGPWHPSSFACPREAGQEALVRSIFMNDKDMGRN